MIKKLFMDIITGKDNSTADIVKFGILIGLALGVIVTIIDCIRGINIDLLELAQYISMLLGVGAGAIKIKETTEPGS